MSPRDIQGQMALPLLDADVLATLAKRITPGWQHQAACSATPGDGFFPEPDDPDADTTRALAVCNACRVRSSCRAAALLGDEHGIWGGATEADRDRMRAALASGTSVDAVLLATFAYRRRDAA